MSIQPFRIQVPDHKLKRLQAKLAVSELPDSSADSDTSWDHGVPTAEIRRLVGVWQTSYDWRKAEAHLNTFPQFTTSIEVEGKGAYEIHFIHKQSTQPKAIPLLFLHGWPSGFFEVTKMVDDLVQGDADGPTFHIIAPSLVGFGFSSYGGPSFTIEHHAEACDKLMQKLGYDRYVTQGGDVGHLVTRFMAKRFGPSRLRAYHTSTPIPAQPDPEAEPELHAKVASTPLTELEQRGLARAAAFSSEGSGYYKQMATRPRTIGYSLRDSPVGLLAWMYEKLHGWSDNYPWADDEVLTWISVHYFSTPGPEATSDVYYAMDHVEPPAMTGQQGYVDVPFGVARFENDLVLLPKLWNGTLGPVVFESEYERGGHFAAWERPDAIVADLRKMFTEHQLI